MWWLGGRGCAAACCVAGLLARWRLAAAYLAACVLFLGSIILFGASQLGGLPSTFKKKKLNKSFALSPLTSDWAPFINRLPKWGKLRFTLGFRTDLCSGGGGEGGEKCPKGQIFRTKAESQQIVGQSLLSCLQYPVPYSSRLQGIYPAQYLEL